MTEAQTILKLIDEVDPEDAGKLDEIDYISHFYITGRYPVGDEFDKGCDVVTVNGIKVEPEHISDVPQYTRSRDALKNIRPEGWVFNVSHYDDGSVSFFSLNTNKNGHVFSQLPTEELAELHAIIQAIEFERGRR